MEPLPVDQFTGTMLAFVKTADVPVVMVVLVLVSVCLRAIWVPRRYRIPTLSLLALVIAVPITYVFSVAPETHWGARSFWRSSLQNGCVSVTMWHLLMPRFLKRWPLHAAHPLVLPSTTDPLSLDEKQSAVEQQRKDLWHEPVNKKK